MKDKIRKSLFITAVIYSITVIILMLYSYSTSINTIEFNDNSDNIKVLNEYKEDLKDLQDSSCKNNLNMLINYYERTSYNGMVNFKDKYIEEDGLLKYVSLIIDECNLSDDIKSSLAIKMITASIQFEEVIKDLVFQYEIRIPDFNNRSLMEVELNPLRYNINRKNQLETIKMLIDVLKGE